MKSEISQNNIQNFENIWDTCYILLSSALLISRWNWAFARQYDPILLKDGFQFFFIKHFSLYDPVPNYWPVRIIQSASS